MEKIALLIAKGRTRVLQLTRKEPNEIITQLTQAQISKSLQFNEEWQLALSEFPGQLSNHYPHSKLFDFLRQTPVIISKVISSAPVSGMTIFTDANKTSAGYWTEDQQKILTHSFSSVQLAELWAILLALQDFSSEPINIVSDSSYATLSCSLLPEVDLPLFLKTSIDKLFFQVQQVLLQRQHAIYICHIRAHSMLPCPLAKGSQLIDSLLFPLQAAEAEHQAHHTNARGLISRHSITRKQAQNIVRTCPFCAPFSLPLLPSGVNPRGCTTNEIWQMDVLIVTSFGRLKYVHHTVDKFSHFQWATALSSEKADAVITHLLACFAIMGIPQELKTDNAPAYQSIKLHKFLSKHQIVHTFGIPYNSQGRAIIERANRILQDYLQKIKKGDISKEYSETPANILHHTLLTLNFFNVWSSADRSAARMHFDTNSDHLMNRHPKQDAWYKDPEKGWIPVKLCYQGRGYAFISTDQSSFWVPTRLIKQYERSVHKTILRALDTENLHLCDSGSSTSNMGTTQEIDPGGREDPSAGWTTAEYC